jgi:hypothetical protein
MKFEMSCQHYDYSSLTDRNPGTKTTIEFEAEHIDDILEEFSMFLRGCGFVINGVLEVIPEEEYYATNIHTNNSMD